MSENNSINGHGPGGQAFSSYSSGIPAGGSARFSAEDVLHTAVYNPNGLFVMMENNFLIQPVNVAYEAARYHQAVGSASPDNVLLKILAGIKHSKQFADVSIKIKKLIELFEFFYRVSREPGIPQAEQMRNAKEIVELVQQINITSRASL